MGKRRKKNDLPRNQRLAQLNKLYYSGNRKCYWCGEYVKRKDASREHIIPLSRGGSNSEDNIGLAHKVCNNQREHEESYRNKLLREIDKQDYSKYNKEERTSMAPLRQLHYSYGSLEAADVLSFLENDCE